MSQHTLDFQYLDSIPRDRECVLFPTYAKRNPRGTYTPTLKYNQFTILFFLTLYY
jgi:hypothetical protein